MKISKRNRPLVLISLILFPMVIILCSFSLSVQAGPVIPEPDPENGWHWDVDVGDQIYFEGEFILTNSTNGEVYAMWKDIWIYNITTIEDVIIDWLGTHEFSQVNATQCYYNVTDGVNELEAYDESSELALFGYDTLDSTYRIRAGNNGMPFILPINGSSGVEVDILAPIINETFYGPMGNMAFNAFDNYSFDVGLNRIHFWNSTDGFFSDAYYYDNGTMEYGEAYLMAFMGGSPVYINATMTQVFDYDIIDEIIWGVNVGDDIYYDWYEGSGGMGEAYDVKVHITSISDVLLEKTKNSFSGEEDDPVYMVFQSVFADILIWNGTDYEIDISNVPIGTSNNFYPQYFDEMGPSMFNFLYPNNFILEDFEFMWNNDTLRIWDAPFDEIYYYENGDLRSIAKNATSGEFYESIVDKSTGIVQSVFMKQGSGILFYEIKSQSLVDWSVNPGDVLYYKNNEEEFRDVRATILGTYSYYANMSELFAPIGLSLPSGQPEHQFFSCINASFDEWDSNTETWIYDETKILAIANIYWPISPLQFEYGPPLLMPQGTTSPELSDLFDVYSSVYDVITYSSGHVLLRNSTLDRELNLYFDETSGRVTMMYGWVRQPIPGSDWNYMSIYPKFYEALTPGVLNHIVFDTDFPSGITVSMDVDVGPTGAGAALIYNYFTMNPVNVSLPNGTAMAYFDQLFAHHSLISGNITMTITLPTSIDLSEMIFFFYAFNMSGTLEWDSPPPEFYIDSVTYNFLTNTITLEMPAWDRSIISAMAYFPIEDIPDTVEEIPGYNIFFISLLIIISSGIVIRKVRKK